MEPVLEQRDSGARKGSERSKPAIPSQICLIVIGGEHFAVDLRYVREVFEIGSITPVPGMPPVLVGVTNLRGTVVPVADLRPPMGVPTSVIPPYVLVVSHGAQQVGLLIDEVPKILPVHPDDILAEGNSGVNDGRPFLSGLLKVENRLSGMLEVSKFMASVEDANM